MLSSCALTTSCTLDPKVFRTARALLISYSSFLFGKIIQMMVGMLGDCSSRSRMVAAKDLDVRRL